MGEFLAISQSSIVLPNFRVQAWSQRQLFIAQSQPLRASVVSADSTMPTTFTVDPAGPGIDILPEAGGGGGGDSGGTNGGRGDNGGNNNEGGSDEGEDHNSKKKMALSMSQKLTLAYAFMVGAGGFMGYLKSGSTKSLIAGGVSASLLYAVYTMLPTQPVLASAIGFVLSAGLLGVMGSRFLKSKKVFPAGVVSFVSFVMTGGYLHGILLIRSPKMS
ncbi:hypothetical protein MTR67_049840 [Solanum verrucosum]|uniref:Transmembrane protein 14 n=1 Tax=Solanum verrucosum TaxID=315347 RepID=A0AAF0V0X6_SOLVR|nr:hypothetical protein MTR67_049840 [Solanum verrucosum]